MSLQRWAAKRDAIEPAIVDALTKVGAEKITRVSGDGAPDLVFVYRQRVFAWEVKSGPRGKQTTAQRKSLWPIVRSVEEALQAIGVRG